MNMAAFRVTIYLLLIIFSTLVVHFTILTHMPRTSGVTLEEWPITGCGEEANETQEILEHAYPTKITGSNPKGQFNQSGLEANVSQGILANHPIIKEENNPRGPFTGSVVVANETQEILKHAYPTKITGSNLKEQLNQSAMEDDVSQRIQIANPIMKDANNPKGYGPQDGLKDDIYLRILTHIQPKVIKRGNSTITFNETVSGRRMSSLSNIMQAINPKDNFSTETDFRPTLKPKTNFQTTANLQRSLMNKAINRIMTNLQNNLDANEINKTSKPVTNGMLQTTLMGPLMKALKLKENKSISCCNITQHEKKLGNDQDPNYANNNYALQKFNLNVKGHVPQNDLESKNYLRFLKHIYQQGIKLRNSSITFNKTASGKRMSFLSNIMQARNPNDNFSPETVTRSTLKPNTNFQNTAHLYQRLINKAGPSNEKGGMTDSQSKLDENETDKTLLLKPITEEMFTLVRPQMNVRSNEKGGMTDSQSKLDDENGSNKTLLNKPTTEEMFTLVRPQMNVRIYEKGGMTDSQSKLEENGSDKTLLPKPITEEMFTLVRPQMNVRSYEKGGMTDLQSKLDDDNGSNKTLLNKPITEEMFTLVRPQMNVRSYERGGMTDSQSKLDKNESNKTLLFKPITKEMSILVRPQMNDRSYDENKTTSYENTRQYAKKFDDEQNPNDANTYLALQKLHSYLKSYVSRDRGESGNYHSIFQHINPQGINTRDSMTTFKRTVSGRRLLSLQNDRIPNDNFLTDTVSPSPVKPNANFRNHPHLYRSSMNKAIQSEEKEDTKNSLSKLDENERNKNLLPEYIAEEMLNPSQLRQQIDHRDNKENTPASYSSTIDYAMKFDEDQEPNYGMIYFGFLLFSGIGTLILYPYIYYTENYLPRKNKNK